MKKGIVRPEVERLKAIIVHLQCHVDDLEFVLEGHDPNYEDAPMLKKYYEKEE